VGSFGDLINASYTARLEGELDAIAEGRLDWQQSISGFWKSFTADLARAGGEMASVKRAGVETDAVIRQLSGVRCPSPVWKDGEMVLYVKRHGGSAWVASVRIVQGRPARYR